MASLSHAINDMAATLERSRGLEQQFLLSISHDLRTPLTSIRGYAEAILDGTMTDPQRAATVIQREANRLERLVRDLLDLAKLEARSFSLATRTVDLDEVAAATVEAFGTGDDSLRVRCHRAEPGTCLVSGDPDRLAQIAANLVHNACKFARTTVDVQCGRADGAVLLAVVDDGPGIAVEDLPHVFERLYVARQKPVRSESGSGLGLAIVHQLVTAMNGSVWAESAAPHGTRFIVSLPLATR